MFKSTSISLFLLGVLAFVAGIIALAWPGITVQALVVLFAVYAFTDAGLQAVRAFSSPGSGSGHPVLAVLDLTAAVTVVVWPAPTAMVFAIVVGVWAFTTGLTEFFAAFGTSDSTGIRAAFTANGLLSIAFGAVLFARLAAGVAALALVFGLFGIISGITQICLGFLLSRDRQGGGEPRPADGR
jgi:uncharacterized membrane protein HdeD (DUF308 family)